MNEHIWQYRVWHIPQIPGKAFYFHTNTLNEAFVIVDVLADYDLFQYENKIKPDYANMSGVEVWDEEEQAYVDLDVE